MIETAKFVKNTLHCTPSNKELKSCILQPNHNKVIEHHVDLVVDHDDEEIEPSVSNDLSAENNNVTPYMATLRTIHAENWIDESKTKKIYDDLQCTQRRDNDLFQLTCCCVIK